MQEEIDQTLKRWIFQQIASEFAKQNLPYQELVQFESLWFLKENYSQDNILYQIYLQLYSHFLQNNILLKYKNLICQYANIMYEIKQKEELINEKIQFFSSQNVQAINQLTKIAEVQKDSVIQQLLVQIFKNHENLQNLDFIPNFYLNLLIKIADQEFASENYQFTFELENENLSD